MKNDGNYSALLVALPDAVSTAGFVMVWASRSCSGRCR